LQKPNAEVAKDANQERPDQKTAEEPLDGKVGAIQPSANAGKYVLNVGKADSIDQLRLAIRPAKPGAMFQAMAKDQHQQKSTNGFQRSEQKSGGRVNSNNSSGGFSSSSTFSSGSVTTGDKVVRPNLAVAFEILTREKAIFELEDLKATDDQGNAVEWMGHSPFNFYDPEFEKNTRGTLLAYFQEENGTAHLKSVTGNLKVTPGRVLEVEFPGGKTGTKKSGDHSFTLKDLQNNGQGIQVSLVLPQLSKPRGNLFGNPEAMLQAMLAQQGAFEVMIEDSEGQIHYPNASGGGSSGGGSSGGGFSGGNAGGDGNAGNAAGGFAANPGNANFQSNSESNFAFAALPNGREIKSVIVRVNEATGKPQSYPFTFELIPIPYSSH
jgi:hypothetical protein